MEEAETWLRHGISKLSELERKFPHIEAEIYAYLGWISLRRGDLGKAQVMARKGAKPGRQHTSLRRALNDISTIWGPYITIKAIGIGQHRPSNVRLPSAKSWVISPALPVRQIISVFLRVTAAIGMSALEDYQRSLHVLEEIGDTEGTAIAHTNIGNIYIDMGAWNQAESHLHQSLKIAQQIAHPFELAQAHLNYGRLILTQAQWQNAQQHLDTAISFYRQAGAHTNPNLITAYWLQGVLSLEQDNVDAASMWSQRMFALLQEVMEKRPGESVEWGHYEQLRGHLVLAQGNPTLALSHLKQAETIFHASNTHIEVGRTAYLSAQARLARGEIEQAKNELLKALRNFRAIGRRL